MSQTIFYFPGKIKFQSIKVFVMFLRFVFLISKKQFHFFFFWFHTSTWRVCFVGEWLVSAVALHIRLEFSSKNVFLSLFNLNIHIGSILSSRKRLPGEKLFLRFQVRFQVQIQVRIQIWIQVQIQGTQTSYFLYIFLSFFHRRNFCT